MRIAWVVPLVLLACTYTLAPPTRYGGFFAEVVDLYR